MTSPPIDAVELLLRQPELAWSPNSFCPTALTLARQFLALLGLLPSASDGDSASTRLDSTRDRRPYPERQQLAIGRQIILQSSSADTMSCHRAATIGWVRASRVRATCDRQR